MTETLPLRIYRQAPLPDLAELKAFIKAPDAALVFEQLREFILQHYTMAEEVKFGGKKFGVLIRYSKSGKTLLSIFPERDAVAVVLVYGKKECVLFEQQQEAFPTYLTELYHTTQQYHDGRWMLIRLYDETYLADVQRMIMIKKSPKRAS